MTGAAVVSLRAFRAGHAMTMRSELLSPFQREQFRRSDFALSVGGRILDFFLGTPMCGVAVTHGLWAILWGAWMLLPFDVYDTSPAWRAFDAFGIPEWVVGAALCVLGLAKMALWGTARGEQYPRAHFVVAACSTAMWSFFFAAFAYASAEWRTLWVPTTALLATVSWWILVRVGLVPRPHRPLGLNPGGGGV